MRGLNPRLSAHKTDALTTELMELPSKTFREGSKTRFARKIEGKNACSKNGEPGHRSQCLSHAKRALYHLSYIPIETCKMITQASQNDTHIPQKPHKSLNCTTAGTNDGVSLFHLVLYGFSLEFYFQLPACSKSIQQYKHLEK